MFCIRILRSNNVSSRKTDDKASENVFKHKVVCHVQERSDASYDEINSILSDAINFIQMDDDNFCMAFK